MEPERIWNITTNPAWRPLTNADVPGYIILVLCAALLVGLTLWTYLGSAQTTPRRLFLLVFLRLVALLIAMLTALRPSLSVTEQPRQKSTIIIVLDVSESMSITDEYDKLSRWEVMRRVLEKCEPILKQLEEEQQATVHLYTFSGDFSASAEQYRPLSDDKKTSISDWLKTRKPEGKRTDFGLMLSELYKKYQGETNPFRGLIVISDGGNNTTNPDPNTQATRWRGIGCPIWTFMVGRTDTKSEQKDIAFVSITADPSPVAVKADLTVKATLNAAGLEGAGIKVRLSISKRNPSSKKWEDLPELTRVDDFRLFKSTGNEIEMVTKAPDKPGQVKVTLEIIEGPAEDRIQSNNKIQTFVTVTKDGVRVLVIDRLRQELAYIRRALASDKRFDYVEMIRQTDDPPAAGERSKFDMLNEAYDVIILGDVSPARLNSIDPKLMENIAKLVTERGVGLMMTGGLDSFGGTPGESPGWKNTPIEGLLPVELPGPTPQVDGSTMIIPDPKGFREYIMRLNPDPTENKKIWDRLSDQAATRLGGYTMIGKPKKGATVFASAKALVNPEVPLLVGHSLGQSADSARILAFGADQTWKWVNLGLEEGAKDPDEGEKIQARFWKQIALWLAHQDEVKEGTVWVRPTLSRLAVNGKNPLPMGIKDKHGDDVIGPKMRYQVLREGDDPDEKRAKPAERGDKGKPTGMFEAKEPGEYRVVAWGEGKDPDGSTISGDAEAYFDVYPEVSDELLRPSANDDFLLKLENTANGVAPELIRKADKLPTFLQEEFVAKPLKLTGLKPKLHPDWRRNGGNPWFLPVLLIAFVTVLALEWGLRRVWGMV